MGQLCTCAQVSSREKGWSSVSAPDAAWQVRTALRNYPQAGWAPPGTPAPGNHGIDLYLRGAWKGGAASLRAADRKHVTLAVCPHRGPRGVPPTQWAWQVDPSSVPPF